VLHTFTGGLDGGGPHAGVIRDSAGNLYGTTAGGGTSNKGVVYKIDAAGNLNTLHSFAGPDGAQPAAGVIRDSSGNLYGTTANGGTRGAGVIFQLDPAGNLTVLHSFTESDGANPYASLIRDPQGSLYGTTHDGGTNCSTGFGCGVVFKLDTAGNLTVLHSFTGGADGGLPGTGSLTRDSAGNIYGATSAGGAANGGGVLFRVDLGGNYTGLHTFVRAQDGLAPSGGLLLLGGYLYGTTASEGPDHDRGVIFQFR
jgi:uncharacterized repeat protein (TIGR03803 family)